MLVLKTEYSFDLRLQPRRTQTNQRSPRSLCIAPFFELLLRHPVLRWPPSPSCQIEKIFVSRWHHSGLFRPKRCPFRVVPFASGSAKCSSRVRPSATVVFGCEFVGFEGEKSC